MQALVPGQQKVQDVIDLVNAVHIPANAQKMQIETVQVKEIDDGGDEEPILPNERLQCEQTEPELQTQGQGLQSKRHGPSTNRPGSNSRRHNREDKGGGVQMANVSNQQQQQIQQQQQSKNRRPHKQEHKTSSNPHQHEAAGAAENNSKPQTSESRNSRSETTKNTGVNQEVVNVAPTGRDSTQNEPSQTKSNKEEDDPHPSGTKLGHYVFGKSLGKGTFGKVKMAEHILTKESVAIKILEKARIKDRKDIDRISREIKILKKVRHPNVIQLYEIIETETELYLIMEYCVNGELFDYIVQHQRLHEKAAIRIFQQLISGIEYIHKSGICHRDLKPENLLLDFDKTLKIVDFGLSNLYEPPEGLLKTACGSPCYAAPEMIAGKKYLGLKSDIWSGGVVLYAMVCGFLPFEDPKTSNLYKKIMAGEFKIPRFLSTDCSHFISKVLQTEPSERYGIEQIREHPWYRQFRDKQPEGLFPGKELMPVEDIIYEQILDEFGFDPDYSVKCIEANRHNNITSTYHLLYKRALRQKKPFTNVSHVTGSLDRAAIAHYERMEAANNAQAVANDNRHQRFQNDWQGSNAPPQHKRGTSTNYNNYKNANVLQSVNGGPETANLKPEQDQVLTAQKRYKMELQAEINKLRDRYSQVTKEKQQQQPSQQQQQPEQLPAERFLGEPAGSQKNWTQNEPRFTGNHRQQAQKRTERQQYSRHRSTITENSEKVSPDTNPRRPQNRVNIIQIQQNQQEQVEMKNETNMEETKEFKQNSQVIGLLPNGEALMMPAKRQKHKVKQYSSQPGNPVASGKQPRLSPREQMVDEEYIFNGSEIEEHKRDVPAQNNEGQQNQQHDQYNVFQTLEDQSGQKVSTISSLGGATKSVLDSQTNKKASATTTKGSNVLRSHIKKKKSDAKNEVNQEFMNSSMPITLPISQVTEPFVRNIAKSGGRKLATNNGAATTGGAVMVNHQMRYRQQKTSSSNGGAGSNIVDLTQFNTIGDPTDMTSIQMSIRSKKNQQYVSLNANQNLVNNSLDLTSYHTGNTTYSTIAAGQQLMSSKNVAQVSMNARQIEHLTQNLNKTQNVRQSGGGSSKVSATGRVNVQKYNLNRASLGGIIGQQKNMQAQRVKQQHQVIVQKAQMGSGSGLMPSIHHENFDNLQMTNQQHQRQNPGIKHRQSFKQTGNQTQLISQAESPQNQASILARRAGSQQWRNNSNLSNKGGRDSVNSNKSSHQQPNVALFQSQSSKRPNNMVAQPHNSQVHVTQQTPASAGDYDFGTIDNNMNGSGLPYAKHSHHHPARIITSSESGQVGMSKPLQLTHINPNGFGQTSENQMNRVAANTIDFHHAISNPQSNSRIYPIQQTGTIPNGNKVQQMKNRKGINQSLDMKPQQIQQIKQGMRASSQVGPSSQISRKNAQSRQFAFESDNSNNYASQISGWVNQSIMPVHQQSEFLDQSTASIKNRVRQGKRETPTQDSQTSNYNMQQIYCQQYAPNVGKTSKVVKGRMGTNIHQRVAHTVLDNHPTQSFDQMQKEDPLTLMSSHQIQTTVITLSKENLFAKAQPLVKDNISAQGRTSMATQQVSATYNTATPSVANQKSLHYKAKSQVKKSKIEVPSNLIQKPAQNVRTTPVQHIKKQINNSFSSGPPTKSFLGPKFQNPK